MQPVTMNQLAQRTGAIIIGNGDLLIEGANPLADATANEITLLDDVQRSHELNATQAAAVVVAEEISDCKLVQLVVSDVHAAFTKIVGYFRNSYTDAPPEISPQAIVHPSAKIDANVAVGPGCVIGEDVHIQSGTRIVSGVTVMAGSRIGRDCLLMPSIVLYENTILEDRVVIHSGSILGAFGFGYRQVQGTHQRTAQLGYVHVESDVEIGAAVTIDRGTYGATRIGCGTKIDNQVQIAHNCRIGKHNLICSQVGIAGSSSTGDYVVLAGQVGLKDHIRLADGVIVGAQAGVMADCEAGQVYLGSPATKQKEQMQIFAMWRRLPDMRREIKDLQKQVKNLQAEGGRAKAA